MKKIEISIRELLTFVVRKWYLVFCVALVLSLSFGQYNEGKQERQRIAAQEAYQQEISSYLVEKEANKSRVEALTIQKQRVEDYLANSILMSINPYDYSVGVLTIDVSTEENNTILNRITDHYVQLANSVSFVEILKGIVPDDLIESYLQDAIRIERINNDIIRIRAIMPDGVDSLAVVDALGKYIESNKDRVTASAGEHTLSILGRETVREADRTLVDQRTRQENSLVAINKLLDGVAIAEPQMPENISSRSVNSYAMGALGGIVLGVLLAIVLYLLQLPMQYPEQFEKQLGIRYIGRFKNFGDETLSAETARLIVANIHEAIPNSSHVLLLCTSKAQADSGAVKDLVKTLSNGLLSIDTAFDIRNNADAVEKLAQAECVLIASQLYLSRVRETYADIRRIELAEARIAGYVVL